MKSNSDLEMASASEKELEGDADCDAGDVVSRGVGGSKADNKGVLRPCSAVFPACFQPYGSEDNTLLSQSEVDGLTLLSGVSTC